MQSIIVKYECNRSLIKESRVLVIKYRWITINVTKLDQTAKYVCIICKMSIQAHYGLTLGRFVLCSITAISTSFHGVLACPGLPLIFAECALLNLYQNSMNHSRENVRPVLWHPDHFLHQSGAC